MINEREQFMTKNKNRINLIAITKNKNTINFLRQKE